MVLKTPEEYIESIRSMNMNVYMFGKKWNVPWMTRSCARL